MANTTASIPTFSESAGLSEIGRRMLRFPAHPRLARLMIEGEDRGVGQDAAALAALIAERDVRERAEQQGRLPGGKPDGGIDVIALLELFEQARASRFARDRLRSLGLDPRATAVAEQARCQFAHLVQPNRLTAAPGSADAGARRASMDQALCRAALAGFSDRVARRRDNSSRTVVLAAGGTAELAYQPDSDFVLALDAEERSGGGRPGPAAEVAMVDISGRGATVVRLGMWHRPGLAGRSGRR